MLVINWTPVTMSQPDVHPDVTMSQQIIIVGLDNRDETLKLHATPIEEEV